MTRVEKDTQREGCPITSIRINRSSKQVFLYSPPRRWLADGALGYFSEDVLEPGDVNC